MPILFIIVLVMPLLSIGTITRDLLNHFPPSFSVLASRQAQSLCIPLVIHILVPLITRSSPFLTALVPMFPTSDPPPGSLTAMLVTMSPAMAGTRYVSFSFSLPKLTRAGVVQSV